jgi:hypothetical protein
MQRCLIILSGERTMSRSVFVFVAVVLIGLPGLVSGQTQPANDPQAVAFAAQSIAALTGGTSISDVTLTGTVTWTLGDDTKTGTATLWALGTGASRMDLAMSSGTRSEIRDASTGTAQGSWKTQTGATGLSAPHNCMTDAVWFFPALGSLASQPNVVLSYIGQETRNGGTVQHLQSYMYQPSESTITPTPQQLSTIDFYLDVATFLPVATVLNAHPDDDATTNISVEIDFGNYQNVSGVNVPLHIQRYVQGTLMVDLSLSTASFNTGVPLSTFAIN